VASGGLRQAGSEEARTRGFAAPAFAGCAFFGGLPTELQPAIGCSQPSRRYTDADEDFAIKAPRPKGGGK